MSLLITRDSDDETPESYHMAAAIYPHLINFSPTFEAGSIEILKREREKASLGWIYHYCTRTARHASDR